MPSLLRQLAEYPAHLLAERAFRDQAEKTPNERPLEFAYVFNAIRQYAPKTILDVGTGTTALPALMRSCGAHVTAIDNITDYWPAGMVNRHWHVLDADIRNPVALTGKRFDLVTCISVLEHVADADTAVAHMLGLLNPGGVLVLAGPYHESRYIADAYKLPGCTVGQHGQYICQQFSAADLTRWTATRGRIVQQEYWRCWSGETWGQGTRVVPPEPSTATDPHQHSCLMIQT